MTMKNYHQLYEYLGTCPICERDMFKDGSSTNQHHFVPKSRGGREQEYCHRICHDLLHRLWTNKELENEFSDPVLILQDERVQAFIKWVAGKDPLFYMSTKDSKQRKGKSRR
jgi:hypothetical protein